MFTALVEVGIPITMFFRLIAFMATVTDIVLEFAS
jgi:hypothetical protein